MVLTPDLLAIFARDVVQAAHPEVTCPMLAEAAANHRRRLMELTGKGVVPGVPAMPEFTVKRPSMEERARRRAERRATNSTPVASGTPEDDQAEVDPH